MTNPKNYLTIDINLINKESNKKKEVKFLSNKELKMKENEQEYNEMYDDIFYFIKIRKMLKEINESLN